MISFLIAISLITKCIIASDHNVLMTEVFEIHVNPTLFQWPFEDAPDQYVYQPSLLNSPDLPSWMSYVYSNKHRTGYLYGVPPNRHDSKYNIGIIALNRKTYETRQKNLVIHVTEKLNPAKYEIHMKINNLNVEDMFDGERMNRLKDVFRKQLWKDSENDLYITFLASAIELGARKPLKPDEGEGVVIRVGSKSPFSVDLIQLQEEVRPLWRVPSCARDFKRTTVERYFRDNGFALDWCTFRLISHENKTALQQSVTKNYEESSSLVDTKWKGIRKLDVPERSYSHEIVFTIIVPMFILLILALLLSFILCFHHEGIKDEASEVFFDNIFHICVDYISSKHIGHIPNDVMHQYTTIHQATQSLRNLSNNRDYACTSPESGIISRSQTNSPTSTTGRGFHCRPSPPPYVRPKFKPDI